MAQEGGLGTGKMVRLGNLSLSKVVPRKLVAQQGGLGTGKMVPRGFWCWHEVSLGQLLVGDLAICGTSTTESVFHPYPDALALLVGLFVWGWLGLCFAFCLVLRWASGFSISSNKDAPR